MPPISRKRRAPVEEDEEAPTPTQTQRHRRDATPVEDEDQDEEEQESGSGSLAQLSKSLVRYALACEYSRTPIKRQDVTQKVLGVHSRRFREVFDAANAQLIDTFGMELIELPNPDKVTIRDKRTAAASETQNKTSGQWVLRNVLPAKFRASNIIEPPQIPTADLESNYVGFYTMIIALISLSGGQISESKLDRYLRRMNANQSTPMDSTEKVLVRMTKERYILKVKETVSGEESIDYIVGPRGKVEVGEEGVADMVRKVYGENAVEDLEERLSRSLGIEARVGENGDATASNATAAGAGASQQGGGRRPGRPRRRRPGDDEDG